MPAEQVVSLGGQLCEALDAVHGAGIVHRDIKPENLVLEPDGRLRLTDFGIARMEVEASITRTGGLLGSPAYMAPEQILGGAVDARSDLFSAGVALYQMLTGELPFQGASLVEIAHRVAYDPPRPPSGIPPGLAGVLLRALEKDPSYRFSTAADFRVALARSLADEQHPAPDRIGSSPSVQPLAEPAPLAPPTSGSTTSVCPRHPARLAVATCSECHEPLCRLCVRHRLGRAWCPEHAWPPARPAWITRMEVAGIGLLFALLLWSLYPLRW
jgi:serine/threonine-protein kinase